MSNSLYQTLGGGQPAGPAADFQQFVSEFNRFRSSFKGDARAEVQNLLNSGQMTQQQYDAIQNVARQFMAMTRK